MKKVVCIVVDESFTTEDILSMEQCREVTITGKVKSIFYGEEAFDKTMKLAQQMEEFIEAGDTVDDEEEY